jgi:LPS sulfotransferase NodH
LLDSTGIAGHPESYFRQPDEHSWAARWGIARKADGSFGYAGFVRAALSAGRTANGVFSARIMWGTMDEITAKLAMAHPGSGRSGADLLQESFGQTKFIYLRRDDVVAQAVSWLRAEQTNVWFETTKTAHKPPEQEPCFDFDRIHELASMIGEHNSAWQEWFKSAGIQPHPVLYEELSADPAGVARGILDFIGLELPANRVIFAQHRRLADEINTAWIHRYRERHLSRFPP